MNIKDAKKLVKSLFMTQIRTGVRYSVELRSGPGLGKSEGIAQTADELAVELARDPEIVAMIGEKMRSIDGKAAIPFGLKPFFLSTVEQPDIRGFGIPSKDTDGTPIMIYTRAPWMPRTNDPKHGIVFLDEFGQGGHDVQKPAAELLNAGSVGDSKLPITYMVICASNREKDRSGVQRDLAFLSNRRMIINIQPELDAWVEWAEKKAIHWIAVSFAKVHPGLVFQDEVPVKAGPFCTPRTLVKVSHLIDTMPMNLFTEACMGYLGEGAGAQFVAHFRVAQEVPDFKEIVANPTKARLPEKDRPDAQYATMQMVAYRVDKDTAAPAFEYLKRMPKEFQVAGLRAALSKCGDLVRSKGFADWLKQNKDLVMNANLLDRSN